ncbi:hypothetical protein A6M27_09560 [Acidithiobacillus thiooxidans]|uniref:Adhesin n=1 Tax=Acidithiobacillus thiooxidans TaxID=930 RepID=A0A1C2IIV8_ACITH|nr:hypothetical protein [Acidithiobacillus thiooxidans]OCX75895.1 hypothetical protein A6M23_01285 [Acidithiobacillus thiooxidans]OCX76336.1 hypothetical protein A6P07_02605 [Acidithiobacillus thiooxidans]OCX78027.1 hypothetical protein A6O24_05540 [Acidithiobacillus thiooxidans]OCX84508.1 hypothetical protein A6O26_04195 [Acidithiobacillus thiooxidans]OCX87800.1 hypothetical protein A6P08_01165 [Acidithiobacillus thiooxidans]
MKTSIKLSPVAIAIAALMAAPMAFAAGANVDNGQQSQSNTQISVMNSTNYANMLGKAGAGSKGNVGVNIATGNQNQQSNAGSLAANGKTKVTSTASASASQDQGGNLAIQVVNGSNNVNMSDHALSDASGNIGANMASGIFNQQQNNLAVSSAKKAKSSTAVTGTTQNVGQNMSASADNYGSQGNANNTQIGGNALSKASGNIGVNQAAGISNQQSNSLALASVSKKTSMSSASTNTAQSQEQNLAIQVAGGANAVDLTANALKGATGNIGVNMASGSFNQQQNSTSIASAAKKAGKVDSATNTSQSMDNEANLSTLNYGSVVGGSNETGLYGHVLSNASGNIGLNQAAGISNQQSNSLAIATGNKSKTATATADTSQSMGGILSSQGVPVIFGSLAWSLSNQNNAAGIGSNALKHAAGNIGVNLASGANNQQANSTALSYVSKGKKGSASAMATAGTTQYSVSNIASDTNTTDSSFINGNAAKGAVGNIGINLATGVQNQQQNGLALVSVASNRAMATASAPVSQIADANLGGTVGSTYTSSVSGHALQNASGNIGLNVAAGNGNQQSNTMAIASVQ